ncbi:HAD family hydrolase [Testudinibacter sp. TR-2022]|nr:HAD family hydrolase [Pasteurellaceae bacterium Phil31]TNH06265.1 HAD family hydrolase [Testudinibacter sp. TR-2022]TNH06692.1 HAD family hydrolase [Testudinibacter sp. TR-2022]TNH13526.1 HAD family hydrolase [Testudinibacter sp. TR-2022]TNH14396.1 HAD family hydrolase [Testudinibacter sp. TR-2022]
MDTMDLKHEKCFGPILVNVFDLTDRERFLIIWNRINLYSQTRGINRFKGLILSLEEYGYKNDFQRLKEWVNTTQELSNISLEAEINKNPSSDLILALKWSNEVNSEIKALSGQDTPFDGVKDSLCKLHKFANIAVVSSANNSAIYDEWQRHQLLPHVDIVFGQDQGTKLFCLNEIKKYGYLPHNILMVGDSPGDLQAAQDSNVHFFPIIRDQEAESWAQLVTETLPKLIACEFGVDYQYKLISAFNHSLRD